MTLLPVTCPNACPGEASTLSPALPLSKDPSYNLNPQLVPQAPLEHDMLSAHPPLPFPRSWTTYSRPLGVPFSVLDFD